MLYSQELVIANISAPMLLENDVPRPQHISLPVLSWATAVTHMHWGASLLLWKNLLGVARETVKYTCVLASLGTRVRGVVET